MRSNKVSEGRGQLASCRLSAIAGMGVAYSTKSEMEIVHSVRLLRINRNLAKPSRNIHHLPVV
jgi:hypothetical protein